MRRIALGLLLVATAISAVAVATASGAGSNRVRGYGDVAVEGATGTRYVVADHLRGAQLVASPGSPQGH